MTALEPTTSAVSRPVYEWLAIDLKNAGVSMVFGLMTDDTALLVATLDSMGVRFYRARHENNAVAMAEGYSAATGQTGVVIIGRGPATANSLHGVTYVSRTGSRVLMIFGAAAMTWGQPLQFGPDTKRFESAAILSAAGVRTIVVSEAISARQSLMTALAAAEDGPIALLLPINVQLAVVPAVPSSPEGSRARTPIQPRPAAVDAAATILNQSERPLIIAGLGAHLAGAREALLRLADRLGACVGTTFKAKDLFRGHPYDVGMLGSFSHAAGRRLIQEVDCVITFGAGLNQRTTSFGRALPDGVPFIQVDTQRANIGQWFHADVAIVADAKAAAEALCMRIAPRVEAQKPLRSSENLRLLQEYDLSNEFEAAHTHRTVDPRSLALALDALLPRDRNVVYDSGNFLQIAPFVSVPGPSHIKHSGDFSSIGMGFGTALGFATARPEQPTIFFVGDGGLLMTLGELETAVREDIPLVIVVMNDGAYGAEVHYLKMRSMPIATSTFADLDFAPIAEAIGFEARTIRTLDELRALDAILDKPEGPLLLDCKINGSVAAPFLFEGRA